MRSSWLQLCRATGHVVSLAVVACLAACGEVAHAQGVLAGEAVERESVDLRPRTVAVFPFTNISGQPDDDWIGAGIAETVTADLAQFGELSVVGREAFLQDEAVAWSDAALVRDLARELGVSWIIAGGFQRLGDQLRVTARIVDVETGSARATVKVDGRFDELFTLQDRIVTELTGGLAGIAGRGAPSRTAARRPAAGGQTELSPGGATTGAGRSDSNGNVNGSGGVPAAAVSGLRSWLAPHAEIDLRIGGLMRANYDSRGALGDPHVGRRSREKSCHSSPTRCSQFES